MTIKDGFIAKTLKYAVAGMMFGAFTLPGAGAQTPAEPDSKTLGFKTWTLQCFTAETGKICNLNQTFVEKESRQRVMQFSVIRKQGAASDSLAIGLPLGVDLLKPVAIRLSDNMEIRDLTYSFCAQDGCYVEAPLNSSMLVEMRGSPSGEVTFFPIGSDQPIVLPVSFDGFAAGYNAYLAEQ